MQLSTKGTHQLALRRRSANVLCGETNTLINRCGSESAGSCGVTGATGESEAELMVLLGQLWHGKARGEKPDCSAVAGQLYRSLGLNREEKFLRLEAYSKERLRSRFWSSASCDSQRACMMMMRIITTSR